MKTGVKVLTVEAGEDQMRLDRWLRSHFPHMRQSAIEKMCRKGELRIDGKRAKANSRVTERAQIRVPPVPDAAQPVQHEERLERQNTLTAQELEEVRSWVLYQDDDLIVLNKPFGIATQGGTNQLRHIDGLVEALRGEFDQKPRLVHRLDRDTSGVLLLARHRAVAAKLSTAFRAKTTRKTYWALVAGVPKPAHGTVRYGLIKAAGGKGAGEKMRCIDPRDMSQYPDAKPALSEYTLLVGLARRLSWMALSPITGRTHQLRAHMAELGHPIIGDGKYGGQSQDNLGDGWGAQIGAAHGRKLHLHARSLRFVHPVSGKEVTFEAPLPPHMAATWRSCGFDEYDPPVDPFAQLEV